jgi:hypothetical protein
MANVSLQLMGTVFEPMDVRDVHDETGTHPEPPLDQDWTPQQKLIWHASLVEHRTGVRCRINDTSKLTIDGEEVADHYGIVVGRSSTGMDFRSAWIYLNGVEAGAQAASYSDSVGCSA